MDRSSKDQSLDYIIGKLELEKGVSLIGVGGVGKTTLSIELGYKWVERGKHKAVFWFDPDYWSEFNTQVYKLGMDLGVDMNLALDDEKAKIEVISNKIISALENNGQEILFIFDNYLEPNAGRESRVFSNISEKAT